MPSKFLMSLRFSKTDRIIYFQIEFPLLEVTASDLYIVPQRAFCSCLHFRILRMTGCSTWEDFFVRTKAWQESWMLRSLFMAVWVLLHSRMFSFKGLQRTEQIMIHNSLNKQGNDSLVVFKLKQLYSKSVLSFNILFWNVGLCKRSELLFLKI